MPLSVAKLLYATSATHAHTNSKAKLTNLFMGCYLNERPSLKEYPRNTTGVLSLARMAPTI